MIENPNFNKNPDDESGKKLDNSGAEDYKSTQGYLYIQSLIDSGDLKSIKSYLETSSSFKDKFTHESLNRIETFLDLVDNKDTYTLDKDGNRVYSKEFTDFTRSVVEDFAKAIS